MSEPLDKFGKFIVDNLRDKEIDNFKGLMEGKWRAKKPQELHNRLSKFNSEEKKVISDLVEDLLANAMHDLLLAIHEENNLGTGLKVEVDGKNIADLSDGLHGEIFHEEGWIHRFSKYNSIND